MDDRHVATFRHPGSGRLVQCRLDISAPCNGALFIEARTLDEHDRPYDDRWYPVKGEGWVDLNHNAPEVFAPLRADLKRWCAANGVATI